MKRIIKIFVLLLIPVCLSGQITPVTNQYVLNPLTLNPAYAGNRGAMNIAAFYRRQWVGIARAPETMTLAIDVPLFSSKLGIGLIVTNDKLGVTKKSQYITNYSYKIGMKEGILSLGLGAGLLTTNTVWSDLNVIDPGDDSYLTDSPVYIVPVFNFGVYYSNRRFFAGLSIPKLLAYRFDSDRNRYNMHFDPSTYYYLVYAGYVLSLSPKLDFFPSTLVTYSQGENVLYDINAHFILFDRIWFGTSYRNNRSIGGLLQLALNDQLRVAYTYDFDFGRLGRYSNGSHEIMLRYEFRYKVKLVNPLIF